MTDLNTIKEFTEALRATESGTKPYDTSAEVIRVDGSTAWVHIPGGVDETPVQLSIDAKPGDSVNVRVSGGRAWITGNGSRPPTDDTRANAAHHTANVAQATAEEAQETAEAAQAAAQATRNYFWHDASGAHVATVEGDATTGPNSLIDSYGMKIKNGTTTLAEFLANQINLGKDSRSAVIDFLNGAGQISYDANNSTLRFVGEVGQGAEMLLSPGNWDSQSANRVMLVLQDTAGTTLGKAAIYAPDIEMYVANLITLAGDINAGGADLTMDYQTVNIIGDNGFDLQSSTDISVNSTAAIDINGRAYKAVADGDGNEITETYMPLTHGAITDLDDAETNGIYTYASTASNIPTSAGGCLLVMKYSSNYTHQLAMPNNANGTSRLYTRIKTSSGWGAWTEK